MRVFLSVLMALCAVGSLPPTQAQGALATGFVESASEQISAGVVYKSGSVRVGLNDRDVDLLTLDGDLVGSSLRLAPANGNAWTRMPVADQAIADSHDGHRVVATINGSLFRSLFREGESIGVTGLGLNVSDGELINAGNPKARGTEPVPGFGVDANGLPMIGTPHVTMNLTLPGEVVTPVDRINQWRFDATVSLFTPRFGPSTVSDHLGDEFVIEGFTLPLTTVGIHTGTVVAVRRGMPDAPIGPGQVVLSVSSTAPSYATYAGLEVGSQVSFSVGVTEPEWASATQTVGGKDMLVVGGQNVVVDPEESRARTAIGINAAGDVLMVTVDNGTAAWGVNLSDLADLMIERGAVSAVNLDGGGSSQMAVRRPGDVQVSYVNTQLDTTTRRGVANALQIVSTAPDGPLATLFINPAASQATIGSTVAFVAKGQDADLNGIELDPDLIEWGVTTSPGANPEADPPPLTRTESGIDLAPIAAGEFDVSASFAGLSTTAGLSVSPDITPPTLEVTGVRLEDTTSVALTGAGLTLSWNASDDGQIARIQVQRKVGTSRWRNLTVPDPTATSLTSRIALTKRVRFRARAFDKAGHASPWATSSRVKVIRVDDADKRVKLTGAWTRATDPSALGGAFVRSMTTTDTATLTVKALQVQAIGSHGPTHGFADIYLDGTLSWSAALGSETLEFRRPLFLSPVIAVSSTTTMQLRNAGIDAATLLDLDAFLVLQPAN